MPSSRGKGSETNIEVGIGLVGITLPYTRVHTLYTDNIHKIYAYIYMYIYIFVCVGVGVDCMYACMYVFVC